MLNTLIYNEKYMKKTIFTTCFLLSAMMVMAQGTYKIKGQLPKSVNNEVFLVVDGEAGPMAVGNSIVKEGAFEFNGQMPGPGVTIAYLIPKERNAVWATLFLYENSEYAISTDASGNIVINGGGEYQKIYNEFQSVSNVIAKIRQQCELKAKSTSDPQQLEVLQTMLNDAMHSAYQKETELIKTYNDSFISAYVISSTILVANAVALKERYELLGAKAKSSFYGKKILAHLTKLENLVIGAKAPDFSAALADGGTMKLHETDAKVKIVYFWATGATPCRDENVNMLKLYKQYRPKGLEIIGVSLDQNKQAWLTILGEDGATWKNIIDTTREIASQYCISSIPAIFVLDGNNIIVAKNIIDKDLKSKVEEMLNKK